MPVILHLIGLVILSPGVVHYHDEATPQVIAHRLLVKFQWRIFPWLSYRVAILVLKLIGKFLDRLAQCQTEHAIDRGKHLSLGLINILLRLSLLFHGPQLQSKLP